MVSGNQAIQAEGLAAGEKKGAGIWGGWWTFARRKPIGAISAVFLVLIIIMAVGAPVIATHDPVATATKEKLQAPSTSHVLGTDELGRDVWSRLVYGARISLVVGYVGTLIATLLSTGIAILSAYFGQKSDLILQRFVDAFQSIPGLLVILRW